MRSRVLAAAAPLVTLLTSACGSDAGDASSSSGVGAGIDWNGSSGAGDLLHESEPDAYDSQNPGGLPGSLGSDGSFTPACIDAGGTYCSEAQADAANCGGAPAIASYDCAVCCDIFDDGGACEKGGCTDPVDDEDCDADDCSFTLTCPDGRCDAAAGESCETCPADCPCPVLCGDGACDTARGETCATCPDDCVDCVTSGCPDGTCTSDETCATCPEDCGRCVKVMTWNIAAGRKRGGERVESTIKAIANAVALERPDLLALQEVDVNTKRSGGLDQALLIAKRVKMWKRFASAYKFDGGYHGLAVFSRRPFAGIFQALELPGGGEFDKRRIVASADVDAVVTARFAVTQLAGTEDKRVEQAFQIAGHFTDPTTLLAGDLREGPDGPAVQALSGAGLEDLWEVSHFGDGPTVGTKRNDYVLAGPAFWDALIDAYTLPSRGLSDHRPVVHIYQVPGALAEHVETSCTSDPDCTFDAYARYCIASRCVECKTSADCVDSDYPTCNALHECQ